MRTRVSEGAAYTFKYRLWTFRELEEGADRIDIKLCQKTYIFWHGSATHSFVKDKSIEIGAKKRGEFGMLLRDSKLISDLSLNKSLSL